MFFIGSGSLLLHAIKYCLASELPVDGVICPPEDGVFSWMQKRGVFVANSSDPNKELLVIDRQCRDGVVFSINNKHILTSNLLDTEFRFYNIHNGLVQQYRGIAEVCIFAALCRCERQYGVTLQRLLPSLKVDSGPVVSQINFEIKPDDHFSNVFETSLSSCKRIFELNVQSILSNSVTEVVLGTAPKAWTYRDVANLMGDLSRTDCVAKACNLGHYSSLLPRLRDEINSAVCARSELQ